jgi:hypothetical protein
MTEKITRYTISAPWGSQRPQLYEETWTLGRKRAVKHVVQFGAPARSLYSLAYFREHTYETPQAALDAYRERLRERVAELRKELDEETGELSRALRLRIVDGELR